jgi:hypothetical protein
VLRHALQSTTGTGVGAGTKPNAPNGANENAVVTDPDAEDVPEFPLALVA